MTQSKGTIQLPIGQPDPDKVQRGVVEDGAVIPSHTRGSGMLWQWLLSFRTHLGDR
jgi:hypothetical protein